MAERLFLLAVLAVSGGYFLVAAFLIEARIQYDPLGPESWPMILGALLFVAAGVRICLPIGARFELARGPALRVGAVLAALMGYALLFERAGFVLSTWTFCSVTTLVLGARPIGALVFGGSVAVVVYLVFTRLLDLNLPAGLLAGLE